MPIRVKPIVLLRSPRATGSHAVRPQASEVVPRRAGYGSVGLDTGVVESGLNAENHTGDLNPFISPEAMSGNFTEAQRGGTGNHTGDRTPFISREAMHGSVIEAQHDGTENHTGDRNPFHSREVMSGSVTESQRGGTQGAWKWWRVGIVAAAVVTTYSAATGVVRFSKFRGQLTTPSSEGGNSAAFKVELEDNPTLQHQQNTARVEGNPQAQSSVELVFIASNACTRRGGKIGLGYPWLESRILVEPYRDTMLEVISPAENMAYSWIILEDAGEAGKTTVGENTGSEVVVVFGQKSQYTIVLHEYSVSGDSDGLALSRRLEMEVMCKYVLREIRSLFDDERNEMFDAMKVSAQQSSLYIKGAVYTVWFFIKSWVFLELVLLGKKMKFLTKGGVHCRHCYFMRDHSLVKLTEHDNSAADTMVVCTNNE